MVDIKDWDPTEALWIRQLLEERQHDAEHKKEIEIALKLIDKGMDDPFILDITQLSIEELRILQSKI